jgi:ATP-binding cassette subfamily B multidrug efflux pump
MRGGGGATMGSAPISAATQRPFAILWRIFREALSSPAALALTLTASIVGALANLALPQLIGRSIDQITGMLSTASADPEATRWAMLATAGLVLLVVTARGVLAMTSGFLAERLSQRVGLRLRLRYFDHLQRLSCSFHDRVHSGDLITRGMIDLEGMRGFVGTVLQQAVPLTLLIGLSAVLMFRADPELAAVALAFVPAAGVVLAQNGAMLRKTWFSVQQMMSQLTLVMEENLQGVRVVRAFAAERFELAKFDAAARSILQLQFDRITLRFAGLSWMTATFHVSLGLLLWFGGRKVMAGTMTVGELTTFVAYLTLLQGPIRQISMISNASARAVSAGVRMFEILDHAPEIADPTSGRPLVLSEGVLRFDRVSFRYRPDQPDVLTDISFEVRPGRTLGVVGPPGSGKSTIAALIPRFYEVSSGAVTLDGVDVRDIQLAELREHVGVVQQDTFLFDAPIGHNLAYADPWADDARIEAVARVAQLHDQVQLMAHGYETRVGERGVSLSGGQRQRAAIARGVLPGPGVIVFDDSTAAIDAVTERKVREGLAGATRAKATVIIAHRLSSLLHADEIIVLDHGRIVERGDHASLVAQGGLYAELHAMQSRQSQDGALIKAEEVMA